MEEDLAIQRGNVVIGYIRSLNIAKPNEPEQIRYIGMQGPTAGGAATGQAHETMTEAAKDVQDWADGKEVAYPKHAEGKARYADMFAAGVKSTPPTV